MKKTLATVVLALLAFPTSAAIQYEFNQKNTNEDPVAPVSELRARALIDGARSRIDFLAGTLYPPGTYVVSTDASRNLRFVDPVDKSFTEVNTASIVTALGTSDIVISNQKIDFVSLPDKMEIAGVQGQHYRVTMNYDITRKIRDIPIKLRVKTDIDAWTTTQFTGQRRDIFTGGGTPRTGNPQLDALLEAETSKIPGFPLRQVVSIQTTYDRIRGSKLQTPTTQTATREMWVTSIRETSATAADFMVPASYRRADAPEVPRWAPQVLTFEPEAK